MIRLEVYLNRLCKAQYSIMIPDSASLHPGYSVDRSLDGAKRDPGQMFELAANGIQQRLHGRKVPVVAPLHDHFVL